MGAVEGLVKRNVHEAHGRERVAKSMIERAQMSRPPRIRKLSRDTEAGHAHCAIRCSGLKLLLSATLTCSHARAGHLQPFSLLFLNMANDYDIDATELLETYGNVLYTLSLVPLLN